mmetsp:Transcript_20633/g.35488  ORF Transcript_20633/g.35488 Transcript_20633/m.35488 type:complete len:133 (+) Transcript_20633:1352-1750(+)
MGQLGWKAMHKLVTKKSSCATCLFVCFTVSFEGAPSQHLRGTKEYNWKAHGAVEGMQDIDTLNLKVSRLYIHGTRQVYHTCELRTCAAHSKFYCSKAHVEDPNNFVTGLHPHMLSSVPLFHFDGKTCVVVLN